MERDVEKAAALRFGLSTPLMLSVRRNITNNTIEMESNLDKYKKDLENLLEEGEMLLFGMVDDLDLYGSADPKTAEHIKKAKKLNPKLHYEKWYTEALKVIQQIIPDRLEDFKMLYKNVIGDVHKIISFLKFRH